LTGSQSVAWSVGLATHEEVIALRMAVLRPGQPYDASRYAGEAEGFNAAARHGGRVVGCVTLFPAEFAGPGEDDAPLDALVPAEAVGRAAWRLRGMATAPELRSSGVGSAVLAFALSEASQRAAEVVWCNARTQAVPFYRRHGFSTIGSEFSSGGSLRIPHFRAWVRLRPAPRPARP
jgi:GNAT superfamily N-acetyltransferase